MENEIDDLPSLDLKEAQDRLHTLEDIATLNRDSQYADRMLLINLLVELDCAGKINAADVLGAFTKQIPRIDGENYKLAAKALVDECFAALLQAEPPKPFH